MEQIGDAIVMEIFLLWLCYSTGQLLFWIGQANAIARSKSNAELNSIAAVFRDRWPEYGLRSFVAAMLFWLLYTGGLTELLMAMSIPLPQWLQGILEFPLTPPLAGLYGLASDALASLVTSRFETLRGRVNGKEQ